MKTFTKILILTLLMIGEILLSGWIISRMWEMFISPIGVIEINLWQSIGIGLLFKIIATSVNKDKFFTNKNSNQDTDWFYDTVGIFVGIMNGELILFGIATIISLFL